MAARDAGRFVSVVPALAADGSPLLLNYLPDEVACNAVQLLYKTPEGETRRREFFKIPRIADKLRVMGPGDAFVDTDLKLLTQECIELDRQQEASRQAEELAESRTVVMQGEP